MSESRDAFVLNALTAEARVIMTNPKIWTGTLIGPEGERVGRYVAYEDVAHLLRPEPAEGLCAIVEEDLSGRRW